MPLGRAGIRHRLHGLVLGRQRRGKLLGPGSGQSRKRLEAVRLHGDALSVSTRHLRTAANVGADDSRLQGRSGRSPCTASARTDEGSKCRFARSTRGALNISRGSPCPADVFIPTEDSDAWTVESRASLGLRQAGGGTRARASTPRRTASAPADLSGLLQADLQPQGHGRRQPRAPLARPTTTPPTSPATCGRTLLEGDHVSSDVAVVDGAPRWWRHAAGIASGDGTFDYWEMHADAEPAVEDWCGAWCRQHLARLHRHGQSRDDRRAHHRGPSALRRPVARSLWRRAGSRRWSGSMRRREWIVRRSRPAHRLQRRAVRAARPRYRHPPLDAAGERSTRMPGISSLQITFHEDVGAGTPRHAARRLSRRHRQLLGSRRQRARERPRSHFAAATSSLPRGCGARSRQTG